MSLLEHLRREIRVRHYSIRTEHTYCDWVKRYCHFHHLRHPKEMGAAEINQYLSHLAGVHKLMALLMYGSGLRIIEVLRLRVKDVDFENRTLIVRDGNGQKDRSVPLPENTAEALREQIRRVKVLHDQDLQDG